MKPRSVSRPESAVTEIVLAAPVTLPDSTSFEFTTEAYTWMPDAALIFAAIVSRLSPALTATSTAVPAPTAMCSLSSVAAARAPIATASPGGRGASWVTCTW